MLARVLSDAVVSDPTAGLMTLNLENVTTGISRVQGQAYHK